MVTARHPISEPAPASKPVPPICIVGDTLCRVRVFTDAQWEQLDPAKRPPIAEYFPGFG